MAAKDRTPSNVEELFADKGFSARLIANMRDGFSVLDAEGVHLMVNPAFCEMTGFGSDELLGVGPPHPYWPPEEIDAISKALEASMTGTAPEFEIRFMRKDGTRFPVLVSPSIVNDDEGRIAIVFASIKDIGDRRAMEDALKESLALTQAALDSTTGGVLVVGLDGRVIRTNRRFAELWRIPDEVLSAGDDAALLAFVVDQLEDPQSFIARVDELYALPRAESEDTLVFKDGRVFERSSSPLLVEDEPRGRVWTFRDITEGRRLLEQLERQATTDALTGIANRRRFLELAVAEIPRAGRHQRDLALLMMDVDDLKSINDTYGHAAGDQALQAFSAICRENAREIDVVARLGGDEFVVLMPETDRAGALALAQRIITASETIRVLEGGRRVPISACVGIATLARPHDTLDALLARADAALYRAKSAGCNCVEVESNPRTPEV